jgi:hypothetical protein
LIVTMSRWAKVEEKFTEDEREALKKAKSPAALRHGFFIDEYQLTPELRAKLRFYFMELTGAGGSAA